MKTIFIIIFTAGLYQVSPAQNQPPALTGKALYMTKCTPCHGVDGTKGEYGAKNLRESRLPDDKLFVKISNGGWIMPAWRKTLTPAQLGSLVAYIKTLRN